MSIPARRPAPVHLSWRSIGLVALGGAAGTGLRYLISLPHLIRTVLPSRLGVPVGIFAINIVGAFLLGALLERLGQHADDSGRGRSIRLLAGTGFLGGFTTYSALANDTATLLAAHPGRAIGYSMASVVVGAAASAAGIWLSRRRPLGTAEPVRDR